MRDFDHPSFRHARARGRNRLAKPLIVGAVFIVALCLLVMSLWNALLPALTLDADDTGTTRRIYEATSGRFWPSGATLP